MSRVGNIETVMLFSEDCGATGTTLVTHNTSISSLEDINIKFHNSATHCTTLPITKTFSFFFNRNLKPYLK